MSFESLINVKKAIGTLNPKQVREMSERPVRIALHAGSQEAFQRMENFFLQDLRPERRRNSASLLTRTPLPATGQQFDLAVYDEGTIAPPGALVFRSDNSRSLVVNALKSHSELSLALARHFSPFRGPVVDAVVVKTCRENTLFAITTAIPDVIPSVIELPWAVAEFASDTAFLTTNQIRMAFVIAGASDREVGYREQKAELASLIGSAFGWRALAREVVGKIPFGGGLIAKAGVAYAGTQLVGLSLDKFYSVGYTYSREEREKIYAEAFQQGKKVAVQILSRLRPDLLARFAPEFTKKNREDLG